MVEPASAPVVSMLRTKLEFAAFRAGSRFRAGPLMSVRVRRSGLAGVRFGFATGKELGGAVERNQVRRRLRVSVQALTPSLLPGSDILVVARKSSVAASGSEITTALSNLLATAGALRASQPARV